MGRAHAAAFGLLVALGAALTPSTSAAEERMQTKLAFVLLSEARLPRAAEIARAFPAFAVKGERLVVAKPDKARPAKDVLSFDLPPAGMVHVALMPAAVPRGEADDAASRSASAFLGDGWKLPPHRAHLIVTLSEPGNARALEVLSRLTSVVAAVTKVSPAVGVYWGAASATHAPSLVLEMATQKDTMMRLILWTGIEVAREHDGRIGLHSRGVRQQLGVPDLWLVTRGGSAGEALTTLFDLLAYVIDRGAPIPEGDTVGRDEQQRLPVRYVKSPLDGEKVMRVELE